MPLARDHINVSYLDSSLFYGYSVINVPDLVRNTTGQNDWTAADRTIAATVSGALLKMIATVSPGAKKGSTAPFSRGSLYAR